MTELISNRFVLPVRVYIEDTDAGGIVFHANYLNYMERARTEWLRSHGIGLRAGLADNVSYVVQRMELYYRAPAKLDDMLEVRAVPISFGRVWMKFREQVVRQCDQKLLCEASVTVACVTMDTGRPQRLPANMTSLLEQQVQWGESLQSAKLL
ncbi:tol-pal system-associated acyl-CoA thioesterase [Marinobacter sp. M3C]|uniref:tol-pal system-associated acyl-CoA thioesterase n=1 Tax=unclassified Marinobacter TaxID=83889 RepID=UPI00200EB1AE|nr:MULTISPECIES: tol-pal system-associated acyl-CoA thioesterase [unclassified Marinobacter]MCL1479229.1 tol-pal system-associated acyl-CoA thioesterase [Marinobacter sp.]MCL1481381.1 tol-pal system-associated acyl-CoA thioesterase [Marinobacter sp.]MCL1485601.1 tol-pal system-associated acyl-CoA thioesterase [Marinobacter sp.]UQG54221.1 tol-pal system-associated acyl-CoA thioesterase [Marinobacter sp. M4C]UQG60370.1 tol-pal system-associated acyl-CoA thioesterase [Marinobacter sp. M3C]